MNRYTQTLGVNTDALTCKCRFLLHFISPALSICSRGKGYGERTMKESNERICVDWGEKRTKEIKKKKSKETSKGEANAKGSKGPKN